MFVVFLQPCGLCDLCGTVHLSNLGTHEVQTCAINNCSRPGTVNITCNLTESSRAKGYLCVLCPKDSYSQEMFVVAKRTDMSISGLKISVPGLPRDKFDVVVFDLGRDGLPPRVINHAAEEQAVNITDPGEFEGI